MVEVAGPTAIASVAVRSASPVGMMLIASSTMVVVTVVPLLLLAALFLWPPRGGAQSAPAAPRPGRPWARFSARFVDITLASWAGLVPFLLSSGRAASALGYLVTFSFVPIGAVLLALTGTTPGKWLFGFAVVDGAGRKPRLRVALRREALAWTYGLAVGQMLGLATAVAAHRRVAKTGSAYWDDVEGLALVEAPVARSRVAVGLALVALSWVPLVALAVDRLAG
jgi:uncharacterized RDD family membrane protein YckC